MLGQEKKKTFLFLPKYIIWTGILSNYSIRSLYTFNSLYRSIVISLPKWAQDCPNIESLSDPRDSYFPLF